MLKEVSEPAGVRYFCTGMKRQKNTVTLILMVSSLVLLIILQVFWLTSSYERSFHDLRRETSMLFRSTVLTLRDSLFMKNVVAIPADSIGEGFPGHAPDFIHDSVLDESGHRIAIRKQDMVGYFNLAKDSGEVQIHVSTSGHDSIRGEVLRPFASRLENMHFFGKANKSFVVRLGREAMAISTDTLTLLYGQALSHADIHAPFVIRQILIAHDDDPFHELMSDQGFLRDGEKRRRTEVFSDSLLCDPVRVNPVQRYTASIGNVRGVIFREITPQVLFSIFLMLVTTTAFIVMFRNIRSQQRLMEAKNEFMSNVTHELKTPVATVSVALEALKNFQAIKNPTLTLEYLEIAQRELERLSIMTDKILKASVFEAKGVEFEPEDIDLDSMIRQMMTSMKMVFDKQGATVTYEREGENFTLKGGAVHLTNVIYNLIDNALKYSRENPFINIRLKYSTTTLTLSIKDNGIGMAPEYHHKIFEKFFRIPSGDVHDAKGYGLGLSYVASVIKSHSGVIDVVSKPGEGSEFRITLPRPPGRIFHKHVRIGSPKPSAG